MIITIVVAVICFVLGIFFGHKRPRASFHEPKNEIEYFPIYKKNKGDVIFAQPVTPEEAFKNADSVDDFINNLGSHV